MLMLNDFDKIDYQHTYNSNMYIVLATNYLIMSLHMNNAIIMTCMY